MRTKIVYVLVSTDKDYYLEQAYVSMYSLKRHNQNAHVVAIMDSDTYSNIHSDSKRKVFTAYIDEYVTVDFSKEVTAKERSRWLKTSIRNLVSGDLLFLDTDTVVCADLSDVDGMDSPFALVYDLNTPLHDNPYESLLRHRYKSLFGMDFKDGVDYYNSGVMFIKDTLKCHSFFDQWHRNWEIAKSRGSVLDQPPLLKTDIEFKGFITPLCGVYNCQISYSIEFFYTAKILHFFNKDSQLSPLFDPAFYLSIKKEGILSATKKNIVDHCKSSFRSPSMLVCKEDILFLSLPLTSYLRSLFFSTSMFSWLYEEFGHILVELSGFKKKTIDMVLNLFNKSK